MRAASTFTAIGAALWFAATAAHAVGFGRVTNLTQLGQPLNFAAGVRVEPDELLPRECVSAEVQSGDNKLQPGQVRVTLEGAADASERSVRVTTSALIDEPVVTVSVTIGCTAKVTRKFVAFIDPPLINMAQAAPVESLPPQRQDSQVSPLVAMVQGENAPVSNTRRNERTSAARERVRPAAPVTFAQAPRDGAPADRSPRPRTAASGTTPARQATATRSGPRLQLEAAAPVVAVSASAAASPLTTPPALLAAEAASAARPDETTALLAKERARIQTLEEGLAKLSRDAQVTQASLTSLQARLQEAESGRYANPLVYALAWLSALLALAVAGLWWRQSRARQSSQWWTGPAPAPAASTARLAAAEATISAPTPLGSPVTAADAFAVSTVIEEDETPTSAIAQTRPAPLFVATAPSPGPNSVLPEPPRELSVEELIDLEQQAEFFIVLGQDDAAIELLMSHVRSDGGISPLPYLKLLEIYRRRGEDDAYQRIRERFNRRFNAYAPDWEADLQQGRSLPDYPDTIARLQQLWSAPVRVMETLDASLFRRNKTDETFDLPAYRELLFLYSIARDLAEHAGVLPNTSVDLLLPLDDHGEEPIARLSANTRPGEFQNSDMMTMPLDLDVSFAHDATQELETMPSALRRSSASQFSSASNFIDFDLDAPAEPVRAPKVGGNR